MWLLDVNLDVRLVETLSEFGVECDTAANRGWRSLANGQLVSTAASAGFTCLLTRDQRFGESAARALKAFPTFAVVVIDLPQRPRGEHLRQFLEAWRGAPIQPVAGRLVTWPRIQS